MKRLFFTLALMFVSAVALNAQSLTGKQWCTKLIAEDGVEVLVALTFDKRKMAEADIDYEIKGMDTKTKSILDKHIKSEINGLKKEFKKVMLNGMPKMHNMKIVSLESKRLIIKDDNGDEIPFYAE